ncbi:serine threonine protein kinase : Putative serine/threonine protein kinase (Fragment) OS=Gemmata sp. Wa1-1 PE=3 SV=1: Pkinase [Gemmataceae bacterium]
MPPPTTIPELLDRVSRSGVVPAEKLQGLFDELAELGRPPRTPTEMIERLIEAGLITRFHGEKFAIGKYKGFQLGSYLILDQLGSDGVGQVYLANHINMNRLVALKALSPQAYENDPIARERFHREARAAGTLDHPNIVHVFDLCQEGKLLYLVMEYVDGSTLQSIVERAGPLEPHVAAHYARQVAAGLQHAYEQKFVHRDIRPANLLVDRAGVVKILDFGLVRSEAEDTGELTRQAVDRSILGTEDYIAPEQSVDSSRVDIRADLYSLGATLYFLLTGRTLFPDCPAGERMIWHQVKNPTPVNKVRPEVPLKLAGVVHKLLRKKPDERYATPFEVIEALTPFIADELPPVPEPGWIPERRGRVAAGRGAVAKPTSAVISARAAAPAAGVPLPLPVPAPPAATPAPVGQVGPASDVFAPAFPRVPGQPPPKKKPGGDGAARPGRAKGRQPEADIDTTPDATGSSETPPRKRRRPEPAEDDGDIEVAPRSGGTVIIVVLSVALLLALAGIAFLLLNK